MQIVIDIPEDKYNQIINSYQGSNVRPKDYEIAIINGTPLPKGHGRLIDADVVKEKMGNLDGFGFIGRCVDEIPTVLEADKEI